MRVADLLRKLADVIASAEGENIAGNEQPNKAELVQVDVDHTDDSDSNVFVPPLQAKLELLKKSEGIPNVYDREGEGEGEADELDDIKKNAGITPAQHIASEDNDITG